MMILPSSLLITPPVQFTLLAHTVTPGSLHSLCLMFSRLPRPFRALNASVATLAINGDAHAMWSGLSVGVHSYGYPDTALGRALHMVTCFFTRPLL